MYQIDRDEVLAFLSNEQSSGYAPQSGEIKGILKEMGDTMAKDLAIAYSGGIDSAHLVS